MCHISGISPGYTGSVKKGVKLRELREGFLQEPGAAEVTGGAGGTGGAEGRREKEAKEMKEVQ